MGRARCFAAALGWLAALGCSDATLAVRDDAAVSADGAALVDAGAAPDGGGDAWSAVGDTQGSNDQRGPADSATSGTLAVSWTLTWFGMPDRRLGCSEAGVVSVVLEGSDAGGPVFREQFPCDVGTGATRPMAPGRYQVKVSALDRSGVLLAHHAMSAGLGSGITNLGEVGFELQSFELEWEVRRAQRVVTCAEANAANVVLAARYGSEPVVDFPFPCAAGRAHTTAVRQGSYSLEVRLLAPTGVVLAKTQPMAFVVSDEGRATLPMVVFDLP
jgi:hypothetical protein